MRAVMLEILETNQVDARALATISRAALRWYAQGESSHSAELGKAKITGYYQSEDSCNRSAHHLKEEIDRLRESMFILHRRCITIRARIACYLKDFRKLERRMLRAEFRDNLNETRLARERMAQFLERRTPQISNCLHIQELLHIDIGRLVGNLLQDDSLREIFSKSVSSARWQTTYLHFSAFAKVQSLDELLVAN